MSLDKIQVLDLCVSKPGTAEHALLLKSNPGPLVEILRLLAGTTRLQNSDNLTYTYCRNNFIKPGKQISREGLGELLSYIFEEAPSADEVKTQLRNLRGRNIPFYTDVRDETLLTLFEIGRERYTNSFLHLYRVLERLSVACPLLYLNQEGDFRKSHCFLVTLGMGEKDTELLILNRFLERLSDKNDNLRNLRIDHSFYEFETDYADRLKAELRRCGILERINAEEVDDGYKISIQFKDMPKFIAGVRNRLLHNQSGQKNFKISELGGTDQLCRFVVAPGLHWLSQIVVEITRWQLDSSSRL